jgi:hypothetical protein
MICDLRLMIAGAGARGVENFRQLLGFDSQFFQPFWRQQSDAFGQLNPKPRLVSLFENDGNLVDEVSARFAPQCRPIICRHGSAAARDLAGNRPARRFVRQRVGQLQHTNPKPHDSRFKFSGIHMPTSLQTKEKS